MAHLFVSWVMWHSQVELEHFFVTRILADGWIVLRYLRYRPRLLHCKGHKTLFHFASHRQHWKPLRRQEVMLEKQLSIYNPDTSTRFPLCGWARKARILTSARGIKCNAIAALSEDLKKWCLADILHNSLGWSGHEWLRGERSLSLNISSTPSLRWITFKRVKGKDVAKTVGRQVSWYGKMSNRPPQRPFFLM